MGRIRTLFAVSLVVLVWALLVGIWIDNKRRVFNVDELHELAKAAVKAHYNTERAFANITAELQRRYPDLIVPDTEWIFINAGGFMGAFKLLHASLSEYILFFGTAVGTTGHSGRYWGEIYDFLLSGEFCQWPEGATTYVTYRPGSKILHSRFEATAIKLAEQTWMLEYGTGVIPSMMPFAFGDTLFSTQDIITLAKSLKVYGQLVTRSLLQI